MSNYMSSRSLTGLDLTGLAVSCHRHNRFHRETRSNHTHENTCADCASHYVCVCVCMRTCREQRARLKASKGNKEQEERISRKLTSHFIPLPSISLSHSTSLTLLGQTVGSRGRAEVKIKGRTTD